MEARLDAMADLHLALGDQKIDLVINHRYAKALPTYTIAKETGVPLCPLERIGRYTIRTLNVCAGP
ncbi:hypothetical protein KQ940_03495 [Marinobacterium sp. D7]|uniref:hypothetical protein n=1 Tax=Marinobacterium ramblicola TaxID=2849041 RepID=UPI001C2DB65B|nr:hypothetical protein [Marinobacterium ramblicola]MBV1787110.1 hypothetical protein [Marinobacterium ramblicola]